MRYAILLAFLLLPSAGLFGQESSAQGAERMGARPLLPRAREIALARSAAPPSVSDSATVYVLTAGGYRRAVEGRNGVACYVGRSWPASLEPHCFDREGAATIMKIEMRQVELWHEGRSPEEVKREIALGMADGTFRLPLRPAMSWMMSSGQRLISDDGRAVGSWRPHLMIYYPYLSAQALGLRGDPDLRQAVLVDGDAPTANLMIVVSDFIDPAGDGEPR